MSLDEIKPKKKMAGIKIEFTEENAKLIESLLGQANKNMKGPKLTLTKFCNWLIGSHSSELSADEIKSIQTVFYSEKAFAKWILEEIEKAESEGRTTPTVEELFSQRPVERIEPIRQKKIKKIKNIYISENGTPNASHELLQIEQQEGPQGPETVSFKGPLD